MAHKHQELCDVCGRDMYPNGEATRHRREGWQGIRLAADGEGRPLDTTVETLKDDGSVSWPCTPHVVVLTGYRQQNTSGSSTGPSTNIVLPGAVCSASCLAQSLVQTANQILGFFPVFNHEAADRREHEYVLEVKGDLPRRPTERQLDVGDENNC